MLRHGHLAVETTRRKCRIEHIRTVGRSDDDEVRIVVEAVHLDEQLVQRLLAFVVATAHAGTATLAADSIDLVDEDDGGGVLLGLIEQVAHTGGTETHEHISTKSEPAIE